MPLHLGEMFQANNRDLIHLKFLCGKHAAVAGDDTRLAVDQYRIREAELSDARCDLGYLSVGMRPCVSGIWDEAIDRELLDALDG
jgi:hypothetical protein